MTAVTAELLGIAVEFVARGERLHEVRCQLESLLGALCEGGQDTASYDRDQLLEAFPDQHVAAALLRPFEPRLPPASSLVLGQRLRHLYLRSGVKGISLASVGRELRRLGTGLCDRQFAEALLGDVAQLAELAQPGRFSSVQRRLINLLIETLTDPLADDVRSQVAAPVVPPPAAPVERPFFREKALITKIRSQAQASGVATFQGYLPTAYLDQIRRAVKGGISAEDEMQYPVALCFVMLTGVPPRSFHLIGLGRHDRGMWIDVEPWGFHWRISDAVETVPRRTSDGREWTGDRVVIPFDRDLANWGERAMSRRPGAKKALSDLFNLGLEGWMAGFERFLHTLSTTTVHLTIERLILGTSRHLCSLGFQATYVDALLCRAGCIESANYHYLTLRAATINALLRQVYPCLGLSGQLACEAKTDASLHPPPDEAKLRHAVADSLGFVANLARCLPPNLSPRWIVDAINAVSIRTASAHVLCMGHRGTRIDSISYASMSLADGVTFTAEKFPDQVRPVPVASQIVAHLDTYIALMRSLSDRLVKSRPEVASDLLERLEPHSQNALFVKLTPDLEIQEVAAGDVAEYLGALGLAANDGRRLLSDLCQSAGLAMEYENAAAGRGSAGREPYSESSPLTPELVVCRVREVIEGKLEEWNLPAPYVLQGRVPVPPSTVRVDMLRQTPGSPRQLHDPEPCPFTLCDGYRLSVFRIAKERFAREVDGDVIGTLAMALIFECGVLHPDELFAILDECISGRAYAHEGTCFVQARTAALGLREVRVGPLGSALIARCEAGNVNPVGIRLRVDRAAARLLGIADTDALGHLLCAASAAFAYGLPGPVREFVEGRLTSRTLALTARARRLSVPQAMEPRWMQRPAEAIAPPPRGSSSTPLKSELRGLHKLLAEGVRLERKSLVNARRVIQQRLAGFSTEGMSADAALLVQFAQRVLDRDDALTSAVRYLLPVRHLLEQLPGSSRTTREDFLSVDWPACIKEALGHARSRGDAQVRATAYGHLLQVLGIRIDNDGRSRFVPHALPMDCPAPHELEHCARVIRDADTFPVRIRRKAEALLRLRMQSARRSDELRWLRWSNVDLRSPMLLAIRRSGGARVKTDKGELIAEFVPTQQLLDLLRMMRESRGTDNLVFASESDPTEIARVEAMVDSVLKAVTGNTEVNLSSLRTFALDEAWGAALQPRAVLTSPPGRAPATLMVHSANAGHASTWTAPREYVYRLSDLRYEWVTSGGTFLRFSPRPAAAIQILRGTRPESAIKAARRLARRRAGVPASADIQRLSSITSLCQPRAAGAPKGDSPPLASVGLQCVYVFRRLQGMSAAEAAIRANVLASSVCALEERLQDLPLLSCAGNGSPHADVRLDPGAVEFMAFVFESMKGALAGRRQARSLLASIHSFAAPWAVTDESRFDDLLLVCESLSRAEVRVAVSVAGNCADRIVSRLADYCEQQGLCFRRKTSTRSPEAMRNVIEVDFFAALGRPRRLLRALVTTAAVLAAISSNLGAS